MTPQQQRESSNQSTKQITEELLNQLFTQGNKLVRGESSGQTPQHEKQLEFITPDKDKINLILVEQDQIPSHAAKDMFSNPKTIVVRVVAGKDQYPLGHLIWEEGLDSTCVFNSIMGHQYLPEGETKDSRQRQTA